MARYLWFGNVAGEPLPDLTGFPSARHTKGDATGFKGERGGIVVINKGRFEILESIEDVVTRLFFPAGGS